MPVKMDLIEGSETSAIINQTPGNYPKESLLNYYLLEAFYWFIYIALSPSARYRVSAQIFQ